MLGLDPSIHRKPKSRMDPRIKSEGDSLRDQPDRPCAKHPQRNFKATGKVLAFHLWWNASSVLMWVPLGKRCVR